MPELPEVETTVQGLRASVLGNTITDVWSDYDSAHYTGKANVKDRVYFSYLRKQVIGKRITCVTRRAKQIFILLEGGAIISVHMKMTGHFLYGEYIWNKRDRKWQPPEGFWNKKWKEDKEEVKKTLPLSEPYNDHIHLLFSFGDNQHLAFSDMRKFATVCLLENQQAYDEMTSAYGPEPLEKGLSFAAFMSKLTTKPQMKVKSALLDQSLVSGFGNIYSDELLWEVGVHPESLVGSIPEEVWRELFRAGKQILKTALKHGGDSMGDYRKIDGRGGSFHNLHKVYQKENTPCLKDGCVGMIEKMQVGARIARFCPVHQVHY